MNHKSCYFETHICIIIYFPFSKNNKENKYILEFHSLMFLFVLFQSILVKNAFMAN